MTIQDLPADFLHVMSYSLTILSWQENLPDNEMPPSWMWPLTHELEVHFDKVRANRRNPQAEPEEIDGPVIENEYARGRGRAR